MVNDRAHRGLKNLALGFQHLFTMFGATVLVPLLTGLDISVALFMAGVSTLLFHLITENKVPIFLGSSFAFIAPIVSAGAIYGLPYAQGGLVVAGLIYAIMSLIIYKVGYEKVVKLFPSTVTGSIIMVIGLKLAGTAVEMAATNWGLAIVSFGIVVFFNIFGKGFTKIIPVLLGLLGGYVVGLIAGVVDLTPIQQASWFGVPNFTLAKFDWGAIMLVAPVAIATMVEHLGDVATVGATVKKDFFKDPGLSKTLLGDGIATSFSAMFGGPANTTYSENIGVLALTKVYDPLVMRIAAFLAILAGLTPKFGAAIATIPTGVVGGISIILFGMIASIGARTLVDKHVDLSSSRNLIVTSSILVLGLGGATLPVSIGVINFTIEGMALAAIVGITLNKILPEEKK